MEKRRKKSNKNSLRTSQLSLRWPMCELIRGCGKWNSTKKSTSTHIYHYDDNLLLFVYPTFLTHSLLPSSRSFRVSWYRSCSDGWAKWIVLWLRGGQIALAQGKRISQSSTNGEREASRWKVTKNRLLRETDDMTMKRIIWQRIRWARVKRVATSKRSFIVLKL